MVVGAGLLIPATEEAKLLNWGLAAVSPLFCVSLAVSRFFLYLGETLDLYPQIFIYFDLIASRAVVLVCSLVYYEKLSFLNVANNKFTALPSLLYCSTELSLATTQIPLKTQRPLQPPKCPPSFSAPSRPPHSSSQPQQPPSLSSRETSNGPSTSTQHKPATAPVNSTPAVEVPAVARIWTASPQLTHSTRSRMDVASSSTITPCAMETRFLISRGR